MSATSSSAVAAAVVRRPVLVDVAAVIIGLAAVVNVVIGVLVALQGATTTLPVNAGAVAAVTAISVLYAAALIVLVLLLRAGRVWARGTLVVVAALSLFPILALNALNLTVIVLLLVASIVLYRRSVSDWVRALRGLPHRP